MQHFMNYQYTLKIDGVPFVEHRTGSFEVTNPEVNECWGVIKAEVLLQADLYAAENSAPTGIREYFVEQVYYTFVE